MPEYRIVIEDTVVALRSKTFTAASLADAKRQAEADRTWTVKDGWSDYDGSTNCEIREDQCVKLVEKAKTTE